MPQVSDWVTVFRSADHSAKEKAESLREVLEREGFGVRLQTPDDPGVPISTYEVQVAANEAAQADAIVAAEAAKADGGDPTHDLDLVTIFSSVSHDAEMEALAIKGILDANGVTAIMSGSIPWPQLPWEVKVPRSRAAEANALLEEARAQGPAAAAEAERLTEGQES